MTSPAVQAALEPTALEDLETCERLWWFAHRERLVPRQFRPKLAFGTCWHAALAAYYRAVMSGTDTGGCLDAAREALAAAVEAERQRVLALCGPASAELAGEELAQARALLETLLPAYVAWASHEERDGCWRVLAVEQPVEAVLPSGAVIGMRLDLVVADPYGQLWAVDHKTVGGSCPDRSTLRLKLQFRLYWLGLLAVAHSAWPGHPVGGVVYNGTRKVDPRRARSDVFARWEIPYPPTALAPTWQTLMGIAAVREGVAGIADAAGVLPRYGPHCSWKCAYRDLCLAIEDGRGWEDLAGSLFARAEDGAAPNYLREEV